jgi:uncharacterized membrane protein YfcA
MAILDPIKQGKAMVTSNMVGSIVGAGIGYVAIRKRLPSKWGVYGTVASVILGAYLGAYASKMITAKAGEKKSTAQITK